MKRAFRWLFSSRFRKLCRIQIERQKRIRERAQHQYSVFLNRLYVDYREAEDYGEAREILQMIWQLELLGEIHGFSR